MSFSYTIRGPDLSPNVLFTGLLSNPRGTQYPTPLDE
ncbi:hypothetical protein OROMI_000396 [Orobanche minor]